MSNDSVKKIKIYPVFLPNAGCKTRCVFCNQHVMTGESLLKIDEIEMLVTSGIHGINERNGKIDEIAFYGGTFTGLNSEIIDKLLSIQPIVPKRISTRPDAVNEKIIEQLIKGNVKVVELGVESLDDNVLKASNRGYTAETALSTIELLKTNFKLIVHLMVGLPNDSKEKDISTVKKLLESGVKEFRIHPTLVFKDTVLEKMYYEGTYKPLSLDEALDIASDLVILIESNKGKVLRLGYHIPHSQLKYLIAGPYHPSFGDVLRAKIIKKLIEEFGIKKVKYAIKFASWLNSHGNNLLPIEREILKDLEHKHSQDILLFDSFSYNELLKMYVERKMKSIAF